ncbi:cytoskeleton-associated protein 2-like [Xyrichtys novacula]|uniref:Cytoskeleton-associated protein 2-like n=1 Tax=Xyrichtys novacula TaxID=13765 RepID=A0AAV1G5Y9_XYRNO|nr:cytoskeleton-associated protein 2-like [Xyrichtys novacula]
MEEGETVFVPSRKELRKQKLMEYLAAKGKLKQPNSKSYLRDESLVKKPVTSALKIPGGKENVTLDDKDCVKIPAPTAKATKIPLRKAFGVANKVNKFSTVTGGLKSHHTLATNCAARPKLPQNPNFTETYTVFSSKSGLNSANHFKKQPIPEAKTLNKTFSNITRTAAAKPNNKLSIRSNAAQLCTTKTVSARMSLGPIVKTKTGLIPAVTQPRNSLVKTQKKVQAATTFTTSVPNKVRPSTSASVSVSQRKTLPITVVKNTGNERASLSSKPRIKVQNQNKDNSKPLFGKQSQPHLKSQPSGLQTTAISSRCTTAPNKSHGRVEMPKPSKSTSQPTDTYSKQMSGNEEKKSGQPCKNVPRTSGPSSRCSSGPISAIVRNSGIELEKKTSTCRESDAKRGHTSANAHQTQTGVKKTRVPVVSQTAPQPVRTISLTGQARKTAKVPVSVIPQTEGKRLTAVQEERMRKLQEWREARGISYKRPPMPVRPQVRRTISVPQPFWTTMTEEEDAHSLISAVDRSLADCIKLLGEGCPTDQVKEVLSRLPPVSLKFAKYWICQARLMEQEGNLDVLPMFEKAVGVVLEPVDELRTVVFEILKKRDETRASEEEEEEKEDQAPLDACTPESINNPMVTPKPVRALICGEKGGSSVVKYKITSTPGGPPSQQQEPARVNGQEVRFFTPVRRSVRIEKASLRYPVSLQEHDLCVASYNDMISEEDNEKREDQRDDESSPSTDKTPIYVFRENEALKDKVFVQLICDESA